MTIRLTWNLLGSLTEVTTTSCGVPVVTVSLLNASSVNSLHFTSVFVEQSICVLEMNGATYELLLKRASL